MSSLCADGIGLINLIQELIVEYESRASDERESLAVIQYPDIAEAFNSLVESEATRAGRDYWRRKMARGRVELELGLKARAPLHHPEEYFIQSRSHAGRDSRTARNVIGRPIIGLLGGPCFSPFRQVGNHSRDFVRRKSVRRPGIGARAFRKIPACRDSHRREPDSGRMPDANRDSNSRDSELAKLFRLGARSGHKRRRLSRFRLFARL
jgi:hypothetical protein